VICQIVYAKLQGDVVLTQATSKELPRYGISHGLTNWTAAYATGLLVARRALTKLGLADKYEGVTEPSGELELIEPRVWLWLCLACVSGLDTRADAPC
jgi:large subunit ribosomal protein L5e